MGTRRGRRAVATVIIVFGLVAAASVRAQEQQSTRADAGTDKVIRLTPDELTWTAGPPKTELHGVAARREHGRDRRLVFQAGTIHGASEVPR